MSVTEVHQASGSWSLNLYNTVPRQKLDLLDYFGHIAIVPGRVDPSQIGDGLLSIARYVGVLRERNFGDTYSIAGAGMAIWLGDEDDKGDVFENKTTFASATFVHTIQGLLPAGGSITEGTIHALSGLYNGTHQWQTPKDAIQYVTDTYGADWRVNNNGTLDAGLTSDLFVTNPVCAVVRRGAGVDTNLRAIPGSMELDRDVDDFTTRVVLLAEGDGDNIATGSANISPALNNYKDIHGNTLVRTRMVSESDTATGNATARAQLQLNRFTAPNNALTLSARDFDIRGDFAVGDYVWVWDPDSGLENLANEIRFRGQQMWPVSLRITEATWPVTDNYSVLYRGGNGVWTDITDYVNFDSPGNTTLVVGNLDRSLTSSGFEPVGNRPNQDTSVPGVPTFITPFTGGTYLDSRGFTKAQLFLNWTAPNNVDGTIIQDGSYYEIRYAVDTTVNYPATWQHVSVIRWEDMQAWQQPFASPSTAWHFVRVGWDTSSTKIPDLAPGVGYDFQIRAVDTTGNTGAWSATTVAITTADNIPPTQPAAPEVASSRIAIQVTHRLGTVTGGDYTLESDLDHLEVHVGYSDTFFPDESTLVGKLKANSGMIAAEVPAVGTFSVEQTYQVHVKVVAVDITGNKSNASSAAVATADLIDDAHISDLTVSKVTAGTIGADFILGSRIKTADTGARVELNSSGLQAYDNAGTQTVNIAAADGSVSVIGTIKTGTTGRRIELRSDGLPSLRFYNVDSGTDYAQIWSFGTITGSVMILEGSQNSSAATINLSQGGGGIQMKDFTGGRLDISSDDTQWSVEDGSQNLTNWLVMDNISKELAYLIGFMENYSDAGADQGWFPGATNFTGSPGSCVLSYGTTRAHHMTPLVCVEDNPATPYAWCLPTVTNTGFTVTFGAAAAGGVNINFLNFNTAGVA